jgi:hypothetical protein
MSRNRLEELVFRGWTLAGEVRRRRDEPLWNETVRLTYDLRRATGTEICEWSDNEWPRDIGVRPV